MNCPSDVLRPLQAVRRRIRIQLFFEALSRATLLFACALALWLAAGRWLGRSSDFATAAAAAALLAFLSAAVWTAIRSPSFPEVAKRMDRLGQTRDRFQTALAFSEDPAADGESAETMHAMALKECRAFIRSHDFRRLFRFRFPAALPWAAIPLLAVGLIQWRLTVSARAAQQEKDAAQAAVADTVRQLENLARRAEESAKETRSDELKRISEELKRGAEQVRANASQRTEAEKAALRELSALEQMLKEMQSQPENLTPEEMKQLAEALHQNDTTKEAAEQLAKGDAEAAAKALEEAAKQLAEKKEKDPQAAEQAQQALKQAMERLAQQQQLSEALRKLAQQMQQNGGQNAAANQLLQQLAKMLRQQQGQQGSQANNGGKQQQQMTQQSLQQLLSALQNMKYGQGQQQNGNNSKQPNGAAATLVQSFDKSDPNGSPMAGNAQMPTGMPGSEHDTGTTDTPFGKRVDPASQKGADIALKGQLGEGESLSQIMPSANDGSKASRRYKELYDAMAPAAEDAVAQENIPLGSRFFVKRYFEAIRPKE